MYASYFKSILHGAVEFIGADKRLESNADDIGRLPASVQLQHQQGFPLTYTIVGNVSITLRESLLARYLAMGDAVAAAAERLVPPGIIGPFCLETKVTPELEIYTFEISARIVAGTNVGIGGSPYTYLRYSEPMYMGRRIARELREACEAKRLDDVTT
jgi:5-formaminoimidazole-4-carboxamide-1-(beta)-D-ribofuranosyl 5'-monophosphate synthetase